MTYDIAQFWVPLLIALVIGGFVGAGTWQEPRGGAPQTWRTGWMPAAALVFVAGLLVAVTHLLRGRAGLWVEAALLSFSIYIVGCFLGGWLRSLNALPDHAMAAGKASALFFRAGPGWIDAEGQSYGRERAATDAAGRSRAALPGAVGVKPSTALGAAAYAWQDGKSGLFFRAGPGWLDTEGRPTGRARAALRREGHIVQADAHRDEATPKPSPTRFKGAGAVAGVITQAVALDPAAEAKASSGETTEASRGPAPPTEDAAAATKPVEERRTHEPAASDEADVAASGAHPVEPAAPDPARAKKRATPETAADPAPPPSAPPASGPVDAAPGEKPAAMDAARDGTPDDLKLIKGIGPKNEQACHALGVYHFAQIADWSPQNAEWIGHHLAFPGRIEREHWVDQAKLLAVGMDTSHSAAVCSGALTIDATADEPMSDAEADALRAGMPELAPSVAGEGKHQGARPLGLAAPQGGTADDLKRIKGIGKQNEGRLHGLGIWHFEQIAAWSADNAKWVGSYLAFQGRITREQWIAQARELAAGRPTPFSARVDAGLVETSADDGSKGQANVAKS